jgi:uncharacterized protein YjbI with pentapeptide repeats
MTLFLSLVSTACESKRQAISSEVFSGRAKVTSVDELRTSLNNHKRWLEETGIGGALSNYNTILEMSGRASVDEPEVSFSIERQNGLVLEVDLKSGERISSVCKRVVKFSEQAQVGGWANFYRFRSNDDQEILKAFQAADLRCADLRKADLVGANLSGANLMGADLRGAFLYGANLENANLSHAELFEADFTNANLTGANCRAADFAWSKLIHTNLSSANAAFARFDLSQFDPSDVNNLEITGAKGLSMIWFTSTLAASKLRKNAKDLALKDEARQLTSAIHKFQVNRDSFSSRFFEDYILGGKLTDYGVYPWRSLALLISLIPVFGLIYMFALVTKRKAAIWVVFYSDGVLEKKERCVRLRNRYPFLPNFKKKRKLLKIMFSCWRIVLLYSIAFQFSLLTAFRIGWRELNVGSWIERLQSRRYFFNSDGWVRRLSGFQSLLSVYLLALWLLTYFGSPFE